MASRKIGIFAGTFDPIHEGHIAFAQAARQSADLGKVIFLPETSPRRKINVSPVNQRLAAIQRQIKTIDGLEAIHINQAQFTISQTLPKLVELYPEADLALLVGSDVAFRLHYWQNFETIRQDCQLIVGLRAECNETALIEYLGGLQVDYILVSTAYAHLASSQFRPNADKA